MVIPDVNLLLYAHFEDSPQHPAARDWVAAIFGGTETVGLPWAVILAFLRIGTDPRIFRRALTGREAAEVVQEWLACAPVVPLRTGERHWQVLDHLLVESQCRGPLISDAHLAALAIENGALLCTTDRDFSRFPGLRWTNPIA